MLLAGMLQLLIGRIRASTLPNGWVTMERIKLVGTQSAED